MSFSLTKAIINKNEINQKIINNNILLCPLCKLVPKILINELSNEITYKCIDSKIPANSHTKIYSLNYFINNSKNVQKIITNANTICNKHKKQYISYCETCHLNLCKECNIDHKNHNIIDFEFITPTCSNINKKRRILESMKKNLKKVNSLFEEYINKIKFLWKKIYEAQNNIIEFKSKIIETYDVFKNNFNAINNLNQIFNEMKFADKPFDFINQILLNKNNKNILSKINDFFKINIYGSSENDEINFDIPNLANQGIVKNMLTVKLNENNNTKILKEYLICCLFNNFLKIYDISPKFKLKQMIFIGKNSLNDDIRFSYGGNEINSIIEIDENNKDHIKYKNKIYLLVCRNDLDIIELSNNFTSFNYIQKIGETNCIYDKALFIPKLNNRFILAYSNYLSFLNVYKNNKEINYDLFHEINISEEEIIISFIENQKNDNNIIEIIYSVFKENNNFYLVFYEIKNFQKIEINKTLIKIPSIKNDQDGIKKINECTAAVITGQFIYDENIISDCNTVVNGLLLFDLINKQIISLIEVNKTFDNIFFISGGLFIYHSAELMLKFYKYKIIHKYPEIILDCDIFSINVNNFEKKNGNLEENIIGNNSNKDGNIEDNINSKIEFISVTELEGGIIAVSKNKQIRLFK